MGRLLSLALIAVVVTACSRSDSKPAAPVAPATVAHRRTEVDLSTVTLTSDAVERLGLQTVTVRTETAAATRTLGGEIVVPEGRGVVVTAPVAGTLTGGVPPRPG